METAGIPSIVGDVMKLRQILLARVLQATQTEVGSAIFYPDLIAKIQERYKFTTVPTSESLVSQDSPNGAEFKLGKLDLQKREIVVNAFAIFSDGLVADTTTSTDDADAFLSDLIKWAEKVVPNIKPKGPRYYLSQIEVQSGSFLEDYLGVVSKIGNKISGALSRYDIIAPEYQLHSLALHFDQSGKPVPQPGAFTIERRANVSYEQNVWFAQAPLKTSDHLLFLDELGES